MISIRGVGRVFSPTSKRSSAVVALKGMSAEVFAEEIVGLLGPSGCGKTTLLNLIAGFDRQNEGEIIVAGRKVAKPGPDRMMVFQFPALFAWLTVWENVVSMTKGSLRESSSCMALCTISRPWGKKRDETEERR